MTRRRQSATADALIQGQESLRLRAYPDPGTGGAPWTNGWGHTGADVHAGQVIDRAQANVWYASDVADAIATIYRALPAELVDELPQECFDALTSFVFNVGPKAFWDPETGQPTHFYAVLMSGNHDEVARQMLRWIHAGGRVLPGLIYRRGQESALWLAGHWLANGHSNDAIESQANVRPDFSNVIGGVS